MMTTLSELTVESVEAAIGIPFAGWLRQCHVVSLAIVKARIIPGARVARGACIGVGGQHSWVTVGDPYAADAPIIDATLWSYDRTVTGIWTGSAADGLHRPHGNGSIWDHGKPPRATGPVVDLTPTTPLSRVARRFLDLLGPLDIRGWSVLIHSPVGGWPAAEIIAAAADTRALAALIPIDILGMLTDRNPDGLYLPGEEVLA